MADRRKNSEDNSSFYWVFTAFMLLVATPIGAIMAGVKLWDLWRSGKLSKGLRQAARNKAAAPQKPRAKKAKDPLSPLAAQGRRLTTLGAALTAICGFISLAVVGDAAHWLLNGNLQWFLEEVLEILPLLCCLTGGLGCLWAGARKKKQIRLYRSYLAMIGQQKTISISALSSAAGLSPRKVRADLTDMLEAGLFPEGFLDHGSDRLVLCSQGVNDQPAAQNPPPQEDKENALLAEIRGVNDLVKNEKLSAQIDQIGMLTAKILDYEKSHPQAAPQLHSFLSYYLPTTLKILRAYGQLETQEVEGENITAAMRRIETMMDKVVEGFEKQLDQLFLGESMDITSDVAVLEQMLAKDGLSGSTLTL